MRKMPLYVALGLLSGVALAQEGGQPGAQQPGAGQQGAARTARARFVDAQGKEVGTATLTEGARGVLVSADFTTLPPGVHAFHVHEKGVCEPPFTSAGGHWNPTRRQHGLMNAKGMHKGDMPNFVVPADGKLRLDMFLEGVTLRKGKQSLFDKDGSALMVHAKADDYSSDPAGNAGDRIACGVVEQAEGQ